MAIKTMIKKLNDAREAYESTLEAIGKDAAAAVVAALAESLPPGFAVAWTQYTPYFNDGDPCVFSVHEARVFRLPADPDAEWQEAAEGDDSVSADKYGLTGYDQPRAKYPRDKIDGLERENLAAIVEAWASLPEDMMEQAFGDHVYVLVRADGTHEIDDYSHD